MNKFDKTDLLFIAMFVISLVIFIARFMINETVDIIDSICMIIISTSIGYCVGRIEKLYRKNK